MKVEIYTTPTCAFCKKTKAFFEENNVQYESHDVAADTTAAQKMVDISHQMGVPVTVIEKDGADPAVIVGFDKPRLMEELGLNK